MMKAVVQDSYGSADVLKYEEEVARPTFKANEVLVKVHAAGVDFGAWHIMAGSPSLVRLAFGLSRPNPRIRGLEVAGVVEAIGSSVTRFKVGDAVFGSCTSGSFAEYACAPEDTLELKPASVSFEQAAASTVSACTALVAVRTADLKTGSKVCVIGAGGGVGSFVVQMAKLHGANVTAVCSSSKADLVRSLGADDVIDYSKEDFTETRTKQFDVIIDTAGNRANGALRKALTDTGILVIVGGEGNGNFMGIGRQISAVVTSMFIKQQLKPILSLVNKEDLAILAGYLASGQVTPHISKTFSLPQTADAIRHIEQGHTSGKMVIQIHNE